MTVLLVTAMNNDLSDHCYDAHPGRRTAESSILTLALNPNVLHLRNTIMLQLCQIHQDLAVQDVTQSSGPPLLTRLKFLFLSV